jgi:hypothetical protein
MIFSAENENKVLDEKEKLPQKIIKANIIISKEVTFVKTK